ncbi:MULTISPECIES: ABC transporter permease [Bacillus]|nr:MULTISPECIES: ABC transporter permease [Bacillus]AIU76243.1 hypothetical protein MA22_06750 [Bacillus subtilis]UXZ18532.1 ABC transporter permease [Bacillus siamensis]AKF29596.1 hypothetical protein AAV29_03150 [Bacillus velezensis]AOO60585.1 hypothetical protein BBJ33_03155 [Bacillus velezensis]APH47580.1 hypothetical protein BSF20_03765 [Bacillus amyloliquefaciens]
MNTLIIQCKSELIRTVRNKRFVIFTIVFPILFYFILINQVNGDVMIDGVPWKLKLMISCAAIGVMGSGLNTLSNRLSMDFSQGWIKLIKVSPLSPTIYMISNVVSQLFLNFLIVFIVFGVACVYQGMGISFVQLIIVGLWIWITSIVSILAGIVIGSLVPSDSAQVVGTGIFMVLLFLGGLFQPPNLSIEFIKIISKALPMYYIVDIPGDILFHHKPEVYGFLIIIVYTVVLFVLSIFAIVKKQVGRS